LTLVSKKKFSYIFTKHETWNYLTDISNMQNLTSIQQREDPDKQPVCHNKYISLSFGPT